MEAGGWAAGPMEVSSAESACFQVGLATWLLKRVGKPCVDLFIYFKAFFWMWIFTEFVTVLLLSYVLVSWPQGLWDLSSPTRA